MVVCCENAVRRLFYSTVIVLVGILFWGCKDRNEIVTVEYQVNASSVELKIPVWRLSHFAGFSGVSDNGDVYVEVPKEKVPYVSFVQIAQISNWRRPMFESADKKGLSISRHDRSEYRILPSPDSIDFKQEGHSDWIVVNRENIRLAKISFKPGYRENAPKEEIASRQGVKLDFVGVHGVSFYSSGNSNVALNPEQALDVIFAVNDFVSQFLTKKEN